MSKNDSEICGGRGRRLQKRAERGSLKAKPKRRSFGPARRQRFLNHFAASCNAAAAARAVGISENCVYEWRKKDAQFREAWGEALDQGYARLEAEMVRASAESVKIRTKRQCEVRIGTVDAKTALAVLEAYRRSRGRDAGEVWARPYDIEEVRARLERKMIRLAIIDEAEEDGAFTAPRLPAPDDPGTGS